MQNGWVSIDLVCEIAIFQLARKNRLLMQDFNGCGYVDKFCQYVHNR